MLSFVEPGSPTIMGAAVAGSIPSAAVLLHYLGRDPAAFAYGFIRLAPWQCAHCIAMNRPAIRSAGAATGPASRATS
ncbi:MAG: hypothetical protein M3133_09115, partial [Actinomycetota bacterium]|nr:hypothetical protein [Actinomycetota bacterium]